MITLGDRLYSDIIAEGVEAVQQRDWLMAHGRRNLQGLFQQAVGAGALYAAGRRSAATIWRTGPPEQAARIDSVLA